MQSGRQGSRLSTAGVRQFPIIHKKYTGTLFQIDSFFRYRDTLAAFFWEWVMLVSKNILAINIMYTVVYFIPIALTILEIR